jgi:hypothetical protein
MVSAEVARHARMKNANVAGYGRFDVAGWDLTPSDLRMKTENRRSSHARHTQEIRE